MTEAMVGELIRVRANFRLLSVAEGGKANPIRGSYRPNHNFFGPDNDVMTMGAIVLPAGAVLSPGESMEVLITFAYWPGLDGEIHSGRQWRVQEGRKLVGIGTIIEVLPGPASSEA